MAHPWIAVADGLVTQLNGGTYTDFSVEAKRAYRRSSKRANKQLDVYVMPVSQEQDRATRGFVQDKRLVLGLVVAKGVSSDNTDGREDCDKLIGLVSELRARAIEGANFGNYGLLDIDGELYDTEALEDQGLFLSLTELTLIRTN